MKHKPHNINGSKAKPYFEWVTLYQFSISPVEIQENYSSKRCKLFILKKRLHIF